MVMWAGPTTRGPADARLDRSPEQPNSKEESDRVGSSKGDKKGKGGVGCDCCRKKSPFPCN